MLMCYYITHGVKIMLDDMYLKLYFIDVYKDINMYYNYLSGNVLIDKEKYDKWITSIEFRNKCFANAVMDLDRINWKTIITESKLSNELSVCKYLHNNSLTHVSEFDKFKIEKKSVVAAFVP